MILVGCAQHLVEMWDYFANSEVIDAARDQQFIDSIPDAVTLNDKVRISARSWSDEAGNDVYSESYCEEQSDEIT